MARPQKKGLDYFPFDVGFFDDWTIKELRGKYSADGVLVYLYLVCRIYKENGYYMELRDGYDNVMAVDLNMSSEKIGQIINFLCKRSLFDDKLFTSDKVLTSHGIQLRFQEAIKKRAQTARKEIEVGRYWILSEEETQSHIKCTSLESFGGNNRSYFGNNDSYLPQKPPKEKKSKVKESKEKEICAARFADFWKAYPRKVAKIQAEKAWNKIKMNEELFNTIMNALAIQKRSLQWTKDGGQFIPHPTTWLNQRRWENEEVDIYNEGRTNIEANRNSSGGKIDGFKPAY